MSYTKQKKITIRLSPDKTYHGDHKNNIPDGKGLILYDNGDKFEGKFVHGFKHGKGTLTKRNGEIIRGEWWNDMIDGPAEMFSDSKANIIWDIVYKKDKEISKVKRKETEDSFVLEDYLKNDKDVEDVKKVHQAVFQFIDSQSTYFGGDDDKKKLKEKPKKKFWEKESNFGKKDVVKKNEKIEDSDLNAKTVFDLVHKNKFKHLRKGNEDKIKSK